MVEGRMIRVLLADSHKDASRGKGWESSCGWRSRSGRRGYRLSPDNVSFYWAVWRDSRGRRVEVGGIEA